jgi:hypothetical protein
MKTSSFLFLGQSVSPGEEQSKRAGANSAEKGKITTSVGRSARYFGQTVGQTDNSEDKLQVSNLKTNPFSIKIYHKETRCKTTNY